jgi:hypothetical protein
MQSSTKHTSTTAQLARIVLIGVGLASAAFGIAGWIIPEMPSPGWAAIILATFTALSAAVIPACCELLGKSRASLLLIPAAVVFGAINAYSFHHAVEVLIEEPRREAHHTAVVAPLEATLATATAAVAAHTAPVFPESMGPRNIAARVQAWEASHAPLLAAEAAAAAALKAAPKYAPLIQDAIVWAVAIAIDLSIALALAGVALTGAAIRKRAEAKAEATKALKAKARKPKARKAKAKPATTATVLGFPKLVAANDA